MSSKIRVLDEQTINKIAAGEVIENPSSVVKELVENALDAGATKICVEIKGGGRQLIRVSDNGSGMTRDDALLCLERHATSKIKEIENVHSINTLGFRGEAIPSIASISKFTLLTSPTEEQNGTLIFVDGGKIVRCDDAVRSKGTTLEVSSLFFNVPVRKKFQRSPNYDTNEILKVVSAQALAHPEIKFELISNHKKVLVTSLPKEKCFIEAFGERISQVIGKDFFAALLPIELSEGDYQIQGYIGMPSYTRHNRTGQYLFINRRSVFSPLISFATKQGYGTSIAENRHPVFAFHITMKGSLVDVNVHPQKREVRLRQEQVLKEVIHKAVEKALQQGDFVSSYSPITFTTPPSFVVDPPSYQKTPPPWTLQESPHSPIKPLEGAIELASPPPQPSFFPEEDTSSNEKLLTTASGYLVLESNGASLRLIDQHAAHSRILYETLSTDTPSVIPTQQLLIPITIELTPLQGNILRDLLDDLNRLGLAIEEFGSSSFIVNAVPQFWSRTDLTKLITDLVNQFQEHPASDSSTYNFKKKMAQSAARAAISRHKLLIREEALGLLKQLNKCQNTEHCPSGHPIKIEITPEEIGKHFQKR